MWKCWGQEAAYLVCAVLQTAQQCQQVPLGEKVPAAPLPGPVQQQGHVFCTDRTTRCKGAYTKLSLGSGALHDRGKEQRKLVPCFSKSFWLVVSVPGKEGVLTAQSLI